MVKGFNQEEKERIRTLLLEQGRALFSTLGLQKTSITQLTGAANIAQGSFYLFYSSKEELFFEVLEREEEKITEDMIPLLSYEPMNARSFKTFLLKGLHTMKDNAMLQRLYNSNDFEILMRKLPLDKIQSHIQNDEQRLMPYVEKWQSQGWMKEEDPKVVCALIRLFITSSIHGKDISEEIYESTIELLAESISNQLFTITE